MENKSTMLSAGIADATGRNCGHKLCGSCRSCNPKTQWKTPALRGAFRLKKGSYLARLACVTSEAPSRYCEATLRAVAEAKTWAWVEFGETIEKDYWLSSKQFWQTIRPLKVRKQCFAYTVQVGVGSVWTWMRTSSEGGCCSAPMADALCEHHDSRDSGPRLGYRLVVTLHKRGDQKVCFMRQVIVCLSC